MKTKLSSWCDSTGCWSLVLVCTAIAGCTPEPPDVDLSQPQTMKPVKSSSEKPERKEASLTLNQFEPVTMDPGSEATVEFTVERSGRKGPIEVQVADAPEGVTVQAAEISEDRSEGSLQIAVSEQLGDEELKATLTVSAQVGKEKATQPLELTVRKIDLPTLAAPKSLLLVPGATRAVKVDITRNGWKEPIELRCESLPPAVTVESEQVGADSNSGQVSFTAGSGAADGEHVVQLCATVLGRDIRVPVTLAIQRDPFRVRSFQAVRLKPGETKTVELPVERRRYQGPIHIELAELPDGVSASPVDVPADQKSAQLTLTAAADAKEQVRSVSVISSGGQIRRTSDMVVRVGASEHGFLPEEIAWDPNNAVLLRRGSFGGRLSAKTKRALLRMYGGTAESEDAVLRGLLWLAAHQQADGRWSLKHYSQNVPGCDCQTEFEKEVEDIDTAATAFGILPMLGAGITHNHAPEEPSELADYCKVVERGLAFLIRQQNRKPGDKNIGHLGGNMYAHAMGTLALCEAYGLSQDERLKIPTQLAVKYLVDAQHQEGGWRYGPRQAGDLSVTSWVFFAIRSAQLAGLPISKSPLVRAERFVNSCAVPTEQFKLARYAYLPGQDAKQSMTAAGLLTHQFIGWPPETPDLADGCQYLIEHLPPESGTTLGPIYYYHYATQVLHNMEGSEFDVWNHRMREHLIRTQEKEGHRTGSWNPQGCDYGQRAGRLYATGMALLTLEVYYRHLPLYRHVERTIRIGQ